MKSMKKVVRFSEEQQLAIDPIENKQDAANQWYSREEGVYFKRMASMVAKESKDRGALSHILDFTYRHDEPRKRKLAALTRWTQYAHSRRGLESQVNSRLRALRATRKDMVIRTILEAQDKLRKMHTTVVPSNDEKMEALGKVCAHLTIVSSEFAVLMGIADQIAATGNPSQRCLSPMLLTNISENGLADEEASITTLQMEDDSCWEDKLAGSPKSITQIHYLI